MGGKWYGVTFGIHLGSIDAVYGLHKTAAPEVPAAISAEIAQGVEELTRSFGLAPLASCWEVGISTDLAQALGAKHSQADSPHASGDLAAVLLQAIKDSAGQLGVPCADRLRMEIIGGQFPELRVQSA